MTSINTLEELKARIGPLMEKYPHDKEHLMKVYEKVEVKEKYKDLKKNDIVKQILEEAKTEIKNINDLLLYKKEMTPLERGELFEKRLVHTFYLLRFGYDIKQVYETVDSYIADLEART